MKYRPPAESAIDDITVRNDTGVEEGGEISMFYDPMIAKLVTHGPTRIAAIDAQAEALDAFYIDGIQHNVPFVTALDAASALARGPPVDRVHHGRVPGGLQGPRAEGQGAHVVRRRRRHRPPQQRAPSRHLASDGRRAGRLCQARVVKIGGENQKIEISAKAGRSIESASGCRRHVSRPSRLDMEARRPCVARRGRRHAGGGAGPSDPQRRNLSYRGIQTPVYVYTEREAELAALMPVKAAADMSKFLLCPMPGLVKAIHVAEGQEVKAGDNLAIVEAMKMENLLRAERDGTVKKVNAKAGDSLAVDAVILEFA